MTSKTPTHEESALKDMPGRHMGYGDQYLSGYGQQDFGRRDYPGYYDGQEGVEPRREYRSRTPGPECMRSPTAEDDMLRSRVQLRSKTPTHELTYGHPGSQPSPQQHSPHQHLSGTPDFIPASRYAFPSSPSQPNHDDVRGSYRPTSTGPDFSHSYSNGRLNNSSANNYANNRNYQYGDRGHPLAHGPLSPSEEHSRSRKQSTSFENEVPAPSNLTRVSHKDRWSESPHAPNRSRSPSSFDDPSADVVVHLKRQESGFGFRIVGGTEEGSQVSSLRN